MPGNLPQRRRRHASGLGSAAICAGAVPPDSPGIGVDLLEVDRLERALDRRPRLAERIFRPGELGYAASRRRPGVHLAARFAAKEAVLKALGAERVPIRDIEVEGGGHSVPRLRLHGAAAELAQRRGVELDVSLTHTRALAAAVVRARPSAGKSKS